MSNDESKDQREAAAQELPAAAAEALSVPAGGKPRIPEAAATDGTSAQQPAQTASLPSASDKVSAIEAEQLAEADAIVYAPDEMPEVIRFLLGECPLDGRWYLESYPGGNPYWWRTSLRAYATKLARKLEAAERGKLVPGVMRCAKCEFVLTRTNLYVRSGTTGPGDNVTEPCPNGCGPLWPVDWEWYCRDAFKSCEQIAERAERAEAQLQALQDSTTRLHGLLESLAGRFRGYLPWPDEKRDAVVRSHEMAIVDSLRQADAAMLTAAKEKRRERQMPPLSCRE